MPTWTLDEAEAAYLAHHRALNHSPQTIEHHRWTFVDFRRFLAETGRDADPSALTAATMQAFHAWLVATPIKKPFRGSTTRSARGTQGRMKDMRAWMRWLEEEEWLDKAPKVPIPKAPQTLFPILSDDDLITLFSCPHLTAKGDQGVRNRAIVALLLDSGIRRGELVGLQPGDLMLTDGLIRVTGKGQRTRLVPVSTAVAEYIAAWLKVRGTEPGPLFWLTAAGVKMLLRRIQVETNLHLFCHKFRHTSASKLVRSGVDLHSVKRILGHQNLQTVEIYLSLDAAAIREKHNAASPFESIRAQMPVEEEKRPKRRRLSLERAGG
jgi:site-specific recombinase XerD